MFWIRAPARASALRKSPTTIALPLDHANQPFVFATILAASTLAAAQPRRDHRESARSTGTIARPRMHEPIDARTNPRHEHVYTNAHTGRDERHGMVLDHRPAGVIERDRFAHAFTRGYHGRYEWRHFRPAGGSFSSWGIADAASVGTVTCEAADENTGALYPVTAARSASGWNDASIDVVLDQALDECAAEAGPQVCVAATPPCTFTGH